MLRPSQHMTINETSGFNNDFLSRLQKDFNGTFPFLKIEFPAQSRPNILYTDGAPLKIEFDQEKTVAEVEKEILQVFGIGVKIFRRSANVWVETSLTSDWTLQRQNKQGELITNLFPESKPNK